MAKKLKAFRPAVTAGTALLLLGGLLFPSPAIAQRSPLDNVHGSWGGADCNTGTTCVSEIGDEAEVTWQVKLSPLVHSSDHVQTARGAQILIPSTVNVTSIRLVSMPASAADLPEEEFNQALLIDSYRPVKAVDYEVPITSDSADIQQDEQYGVSPFVKNPGLEYANSREQYYSDYLGVEPSHVAEQPDWDSYQVGFAGSGVYTFEVTGTVAAGAEDSYVPIRAENMMWKCSQEGGGAGSYEEGCQSLKDYPWGRTGELPPVTTPEQSEAVKSRVAQIYEEQGTRHGITGIGQCAVTRNLSRFDTIGNDIEAAAAEKYGAYKRTFNLNANAAVTYTGSLNGGEDNCDQGYYHITICEKDEPATTTPVTEEPGVEPPVDQEPGVEPPVEDVPTTTTPVTEEPAAEPPVEDVPTTTTPVTEEPTTTTPVTEEPGVEPSVVDEPTTTTPETYEPAAEPSVVDEPTTTTPATGAPGIELKIETKPESPTQREVPLKPVLPPLSPSEIANIIGNPRYTETAASKKNPGKPSEQISKNPPKTDKENRPKFTTGGALLNA